MAKRNKGRKAKALPIIQVAAETSAQKHSDIGRGTINHNAMAALVTSKVFTMKIEKAKKGKGAYQRKAKHSGKECYQIAA